MNLNRQHLSRRHRIPIHCARCSKSFESEGLRDQHLREETCEVLPAKEWDGINDVQRKQLEGRVSWKRSREENWYIIYEILFPRAPLPASPFIAIGLSQELSALQDFIALEGPAIVDEIVRTELPATLRPQEDEVQSFLQRASQEMASALLARWEERQSSGVLNNISPSTEPVQDRAGHLSTSTQLEVLVGSDQATIQSTTSSNRSDSAHGSSIHGTQSSTTFTSPSIRESRDSLDFMSDIPHPKLSHDEKSSAKVGENVMIIGSQTSRDFSKLTETGLRDAVSSEEESLMVTGNFEHPTSQILEWESYFNQELEEIRLDYSLLEDAFPPHSDFQSLEM